MFNRFLSNDDDVTNAMNAMNAMNATDGFDAGGNDADHARGSGLAPRHRRVSPAAAAQAAVDRFTEEQMFEEDVRTVLSMMRPHRKERLMGWNEYRTGGAQFRATISWEPGFEQAGSDRTSDAERGLSIPHMTDVLESILVGSVKNQDDLHAHEEFEIYRDVVRELYRRLDEMQSCYE
jgi:hypothetical protein